MGINNGDKGHKDRVKLRQQRRQGQIQQLVKESGLTWPPPHYMIQ